MRVDDARTYELRVADHLDERWSAGFDRLVLAHHADGTTTLTGPVADQAQLHGILARLRDLGATLLSCRVVVAAVPPAPVPVSGRAAPAPGLDAPPRDGS